MKPVMRVELDWRQLFCIAQMAATIHAGRLCSAMFDTEANFPSQRAIDTTHDNPAIDPGNCHCVEEAFALYQQAGKEMDKT